MPRRRNVIAEHLRAIRAAAAQIERAVTQLAAAINGRPQLALRAANRKSSRKIKLSPKRRAALNLQGQYIGYLRYMKARQQTQVKAV